MPQVVRPPAVAGAFYPASAGTLGALVDRLLAGASPVPRGPCPKAIIVPHAGYVYSGPIAATRVRAARAARATHRARRAPRPGAPRARRGLGVARRRRLATPLGEIAVDSAALAGVPERGHEPGGARARALARGRAPVPPAGRSARAVVPLAVGDARPEEVAHVLECALGRPGDGRRRQLRSLALPAVRRRARASTEHRRAHRRARHRRSTASKPAARRGINGLLAVARERACARSSSICGARATRPARATRWSATARSRSTRGRAMNVIPRHERGAELARLGARAPARGARRSARRPARAARGATRAAPRSSPCAGRTGASRAASGASSRGAPSSIDVARTPSPRRSTIRAPSPLCARATSTNSTSSCRSSRRSSRSRSPTRPSALAAIRPGVDGDRPLSGATARRRSFRRCGARCPDAREFLPR